MNSGGGVVVEVAESVKNMPFENGLVPLAGSQATSFNGAPPGGVP